MRDNGLIQGCDTIFTGACNMQCTYCYIHKHPENMANYNNKVRTAIIDGTYQKNFIECLQHNKETLESIALWGGEPTVNSDLFEAFIFPLFDFFPNINYIHFSTNGSRSLIPFLEPLVRYSKEHNGRKFSLNVQFSIDGPPDFNDLSRAIGATEQSKETCRELIRFGNDNCNENVTLKTFPKATLDENNYRRIIIDNNLFRWFKFFDDWQDELNNLTINPNIEHTWATEPSLVQPLHNFEDFGDVYAEYCRQVSALNEKDFKYYTHPIKKHAYFYFESFLEPNYSYGTLSCGGGMHFFSIDYLGHLMSCHQCYDNVHLGGRTEELKNLYESSVAATDDEKIRLDYNYKVYWDNTIFRRNNMISAMMLLIKTGEIDAHYLEPFYINALFAIINNEARCYLGEAIGGTQSIYLQDIGSIRLYCHGALEEVLKYYEKWRSRFNVKL